MKKMFYVSLSGIGEIPTLERELFGEIERGDLLNLSVVNFGKKKLKALFFSAKNKAEIESVVKKHTDNYSIEERKEIK